MTLKINVQPNVKDITTLKTKTDVQTLQNLSLMEIETLMVYQIQLIPVLM